MIKKTFIGFTLLISGIALAVTANAATTCLLPSSSSGSQIVTCATQTGVSNATNTHAIKTKDGLIRTYTVHLPPSYDKTKAYKLVVALHGGFGSGASMETQTNLSKVADMRTGEKFIIVYPDGYKDVARAWNAGGCCGSPVLKNIDDVSFIKELVASLKTKYNISRVYATGMSNGGMLANRLACEASDIFTRVAPVSGTIQVPTCTPTKPVGILMVHGTADTRVPYNGGFGTGKPTAGVTFVSVPKTLSDWAIRNKCSTNFSTTVVPPLTNDGITIDKLSYSKCLVPTMLYRVNGGSHSWPGGTATSINILEDKSPTQSLNTSKVILDFFAGTSSAIIDPGTIVGVTPLVPNVTLMTGSVIDAIKADMTLNEAPLLGVSSMFGWHTRSIMSMGGTPRGDNTPYYWNPANPTYKNSNYWNAIAPWFVIYQGADNKATNVRVKISEITLYVLKKSTNKWELVGLDASNPIWASYYQNGLTAANASGSAKPRIEPDGKLSYKLGTSTAIHGGSGKFEIIGSDIKAAFAKMKTELILDNPLGVDDRSKAQLVATIGSDYYPSMTTTVADFTPVGYVPNVAGSRFGLVSSVPRTHYMATINPPGQEKNISDYSKAGGVSSISTAEFESNLPPNLTSGTVGLNSNFTLNWNSASSTVTDYQIKIDNGTPISKGTALSMTTTPASLKFVAGSTHTFSVRACNATLCSAWSAGKVLTVSSTTPSSVVINNPPTISGTPALAITLGGLYTFTPTATDINNDPLTFTIVNKPTWATFDTTTGKLSGTSTTLGTTTDIKISVTDGKSIAVSLPLFSVVVGKVTTNAKLLFKTNFGKGVTLGEPYRYYSSGKGAWQDLKGTDSETGYSFPVTGIPNQNFSGIQWITYTTVTPDTIGENISTEIREVTGPTGKPVNELFASVKKKGPLGVGSAQAQFMVRRDHKYGDVNDMYITYWAKHPADLISKLDPTVSSANWRAQFEFKTGGYENTGKGDYRIQTTIMKGTNGKLYWMSKGDNVANGPWPRVDYWVERNYDVPVPLDKWFKYEVYWHRSSGADGRYWTAVDGQVLFDHKGPNMGDYNLPINRIFFAPAYSGGNTPVESHITGLEIWDGFPCGTGVSCYQKP